MFFKTIFKKLSLLILLASIVISIFIYSNKISAKTASDIVLIPHNAEYILKMISKNSNSPLSNVQGTMEYHIDDECDGWAISQKFLLNYFYNGQNSTIEEKHFTNWEAKDGSFLQFASKTISNNILKETLRGSAEKEKDGTGLASFSTPDGLEFTLSKNTVFPNQYVIELLEHAKKGKKFFNKIMFDGADTKGSLELNSFIGKKLSVSELKELQNNSNIDKNLLGKYAWKIRVAFFQLHNDEETPSYEIDLILHDNGVVSSTIIRYKNFAISEYITHLSKRKNGYCEQ